jgi:hypothetical protein
LDPIEVLKLLSAKPIVVGIAVVGALFTCLPYVFSKTASDEENFSGDGHDAQTGNTPPWVKLVNKFGYGLMGISVFLFIVAGFVVDL